MTLNELLKDKLTINGIWVDSNQTDEHRHRFWLESMKKKYKKIRYQTQNGMKEVLFPKHVKVHEILLYILKNYMVMVFFMLQYLKIISSTII